MPEIRLRLATETDAAFLTDVVIEATRDQTRFAADFDEQSFRERSAVDVGADCRCRR